MKRINLILGLFIVLQSITVENINAQEDDVLRVAFWNFENFFDPFVDSTRTYNEFTEDGSQHWTISRFYKKRNNMYRAILALSDYKSLGILGIAEVENIYALMMLFAKTPLKKYHYRCIHYESEDKRGIDVALVYAVDKLRLINSQAIPLRDPKNKRFRSRDILYAQFSDKKGDTLHCFVNHWPSRYGGERETIYLRGLAAKLLKSKVDSLILNHQEMPEIIIMGDFNDCPDDPSILDVLCAKSLKDSTKDDVLINLFTDEKELGFEGTLKHQYHWQIFDQIIVSKSLLNDSNSLYYKKNSASIFHPDFLFEKDEVYGGVKLFRTYVGPKYFGGYSDHLPVYIDLISNQ